MQSRSAHIGLVLKLPSVAIIEAPSLIHARMRAVLYGTQRKEF
jgi:hypothetical protein